MSQTIRLFLGCLAGQLVVCVAGFYMLPGLRDMLTAEDSLIENLSAFLFLAAAVHAGWLGLRHGSRRGALLLVAVIGLVGFLDEVSFGERLFGFSMPTIAGVKVDGVHDVVRFALRPLRQWLKSSPSGPWIMGAFATIFAVAAFVTAWVFRVRLGAWLRKIRNTPTYAAWSIFVGLLAAAILLDERIVRLRVFEILEEVIEMNAALALILVAACTRAEKTEASAAETRTK